MKQNKIFLIILFFSSFLFLGGYWIIKYQNFLVSTNSSRKVVHISFDDVVCVLKDLKENSCYYESIFKNTFLKELKALHDEYGACFSLYVFEEYGDFHIEDMPILYKKEFRENSDWLKFGFHSKGPDFDKNMSLSDFKTSFFNVQKAITHFADSNSLSPVLRLHYYSANDSMVNFMYQTGIVKGLLGADDNRVSYDLSLKENELFGRNFYLRKDMKYFKTNLRLENVWLINYSLSCLQNRDTLVIFTHEWAYLPQTSRQWISRTIHSLSISVNWRNRSKLRRSIKWLKDHEYQFVFL